MSKYRGVVYSTIQYKYLREEMIKMLGTLIDSVVVQLSGPLQRLTDALIDFSDAYGNNLGIYYGLYGMCASYMQGILATRDTQSANLLMDAVITAVSNGKDLSKASNELREALKQLERTIISIASSTNTRQLEADVEAAYSEARKFMMETENRERDLAIEQSTLKLLENTKMTQEQIQQNLQQRIRKELEAAKGAEEQLQKARDENGRIVTTTHHAPYYGWRWWYYGGEYSYTTSSTKDTTVEQNTAKRNISAIDERVNELKGRLDQTVKTNITTQETTAAKISSYN